jgi:hypothetical protein
MVRSSFNSPIERGRARTIADDPDFQAGNAAGERRGGAQQHVHAFAPVEPADK